MIEVNQAIFGEGRDHGHSLLGSSYANDLFANQISGFTDLVDRPANGVLSEPIIRGFVIKEHFLLVKSFPDPTGRLGRVFSHALIISQNDYTKVKDITDLLRFHLKEIDKDSKIDVIRYADSPPDRTFSTSNRIRIATDAVVNHADYDNTIVWAGEFDYWNWIGAIWPQLPPQVKLNTRIGNAFNARNVNKATLNLLVIPLELKSNWLRENCKVVDDQLPPSGEQKLQNYLLGLIQDNPELTSIIVDLEPTIAELDDLRILDKYAATYVNIDTKSSFKELLMLADLVSRYNPNPKSARKGKLKILTALGKHIPNISANEFLLLQHQTWIGYDAAEAKDTVGVSVRQWLDTNLFPDTPEIEKSRIAITALKTPEKKWWHNQLTDYITYSLSSWKSKYSPVIWNWFESDPNSVRDIVKLLPNNAEKDLVNTLPDIDKILGETIITVAIEKKWFHLLGMTAIVQYQSKKAFGLILASGGKYLDLEILRKMSNKIRDEVFVLDASEINDPRLTDIAADHIAGKKTLKNKIDISKSGWQQIWLQSIRKGSNAWDGIEDPSSVLFKIMDHLLAGLGFNSTLINEIGKGPYGSLKNYENRRSVWTILPEDQQPPFLTSTLIDILKDFDAGKTQLNTLEKPLLDFLNSRAMIETIVVSSDLAITAKLAVLSQSKKITEDDAKKLVSSPFTHQDAEKFGAMILSNSWKDIAGNLFGIRDKRSDLAPALKECSGLLGFGERLILAASGYGSKLVSQTEFWGVLLSKGTDLYPDGPNQNGLWERSGGRRSDLHSNGSGKQIWNNAIGHIKSGGSPRPEDLLNKMIEDFSYDDSLKQLRKIT